MNAKTVDVKWDRDYHVGEKVPIRIAPSGVRTPFSTVRKIRFVQPNAASMPSPLKALVLCVTPNE